MSHKKPIVWSIAGSDCSAGAGVQADNQVFRSFDLAFGNIITAVTAQNSQGVSNISLMSESMLKDQWHSLATEMPADAIKIGMIGDKDRVNTIHDCLANFEGWVVCDPVLFSTSGGCLMQHADAYRNLLHRVSVITPNINEFKAIFHEEVQSLGMDKAALLVSQKYSLCVIITGGDNSHNEKEAIDILVSHGQRYEFSSTFVDTVHTHGTGCSLSSALTACLALGYDIKDAFILAKSYINQGLKKPSVANYSPAAFQHSEYFDELANLPSVNSQRIKPYQFKHLSEGLGLYALVDSLEGLEQCLVSGVKTLQLRIKSGSEHSLDDQIRQAITMANAYKTPLFINDYWQLAIKYGAFGVHLGQEDLDTADLDAIHRAGLYLGISTHNWYEIARAHTIKPSYIAFGPIFQTQTKKITYHTIALNTLQRWVDLLQNHYALTAIGGINTKNAKSVIATGIDSIAVVGAIKHAENTKQVITQLNNMLES